MSLPFVFRACLLACVVAAPASAYKEVPPPPNVVLPKPRSAAESLAAIKVPDGLVVELVAAEPRVMDPIDLAWGADGRMWVVEMADYPLGLDGKGTPGGRIRFLESTRGDGRFDKSTLFADGLNYPTSVMPWRNGVLVTAVPDILFLEDTDGDGRADRRTKLFTGLGEGNQQHLVNGLQWSLDGWLQMANGDSGGKVTAMKTGRMLELGRRDFRIQPDDGGIEFVSGQTQVGRNRDDWGNWFGCNNSNPFWHYALEDRYLQRNPHLVPPSAVVSIGATPGAAPIFPTSETIARFNDPDRRNRFTSANGLMIYRDDFLGSDFAGNAFVCESVHNLVSRLVIRPAGATFKGARAATEQTSEFFASTDNWSRFTGVRAGPDGALYIADMYRLVIEHPKWIPDAWQKQLGDLRAGSEQGRIYRVRPKGVALRPVPRLDRAAPSELVAALESRSGIVRDLAQQQLAWRGAAAAGAAEAVAELAAKAARPESRGQALWTLQTMGALSSKVIATGLSDQHAGVRRQAVRLSELFAETNPELLPAIVALANDSDAMVRQQVAYTLGEWKDPRAGVALAGLLRASDDRFIRAAAMSSALPHADTLIAELSANGRADDPLVIEIATATNNAKAFGSILAAIAAPREGGGMLQQFRALAQLLDWLQRSNKSLAQLQASGGGAIGPALAAIDGVFAAARAVIVDPNAPVEQRLAAVNIVGRGRARQDEDLQLLASLLTPRSPVDVQLAVVAALGRLNRPNVPDKLLEGWNAHGPKVRAAVLQLVTSRPAWAQVLLDRVEADRSMLAQIDAGPRTSLTQHSNAKLAQRATEIFAAGIDLDRQKAIDRYLAALSGKTGESARGATVFANVCSACHKFGDVAGRAIGPDIAVVKDRSAPYLLTHILDPNRAVEDRYVLYTAATQDGRALAGMLSAEAANSITLIGLDGVEQVVLRSELRSLVSTGRSLMPDGLEAAINEQAMADLIAFLAGGGSRNE